RVKGFKEIYRSLKLGGKVVASSWAPITQSPAMMAVFGALRAMNPDIPEPQTDIKSLENPDLFKSEMEQAGFKNVEVFVVTKGMAIEAREQYWDDMIKGSAPIAMMKRSLSDEQWQEKNKIALEFLSKHIPKVPAELTADAWFGYGEK
ncbi:MAG: SAM-dependent methyltransferase, partial [Gammaproteobacteria bacterium]|nr:SAM-dependent methyltransferase [Gammaproteobacteria bacterium]